MQSDFTTLLTLRESIVQSNDYLRLHSQAFIDQRLRLEKAIFQRLKAQALADSRSVDHTNAEASVPTTAVTPAPTLRVPEGDYTVPAPTIQTRSVTRQPSDSHDGRLVLASISVGVLMLLILVSIGTIRSIVAPVRQLLQATAQLAHGRTQVRVPRGGIRELDTLALAFHNMAGELDKARAESRTYQEQLENRVTERTRQLQALAEQDPLTGLSNRRELFVLLNIGNRARCHRRPPRWRVLSRHRQFQIHQRQHGSRIRGPRAGQLRCDGSTKSPGRWASPHVSVAMNSQWFSTPRRALKSSALPVTDGAGLSDRAHRQHPTLRRDCERHHRHVRGTRSRNHRGRRRTAGAIFHVDSIPVR